MLVELKHHQSAVDKELQKKTRVLERQQKYHRERFQGEKSQVLHRVQLHQAQLVEVQKLYQLAILLWRMVVNGEILVDGDLDMEFPDKPPDLAPEELHRSRLRLRRRRSQG